MQPCLRSFQRIGLLLRIKKFYSSYQSPKVAWFWGFFYFSCWSERPLLLAGIGP